MHVRSSLNPNLVLIVDIISRPVKRENRLKWTNKSVIYFYLQKKQKNHHHHHSCLYDDDDDKKTKLSGTNRIFICHVIFCMSSLFSIPFFSPCLFLLQWSDVMSGWSPSWIFLQQVCSVLLSRKKRWAEKDNTGFHGRKPFVIVLVSLQQIVDTLLSPQ